MTILDTPENALIPEIRVASFFAADKPTATHV